VYRGEPHLLGKQPVCLVLSDVGDAGVRLVRTEGMGLDFRPSPAFPRGSAVKSTPVALVVLAAVVAVVGVSGFAPVPAQPAPRVSAFEYKFLVLTHGDVVEDEKQLNALAGTGWEVVETTTSGYGTNGSVSPDARLVLKRAKR
jgi:hypothetical protein